MATEAIETADPRVARVAQLEKDIQEAEEALRAAKDVVKLRKEELQQAVAALRAEARACDMPLFENE